MEVVSQAGRLGSGILDLSMGLFGLQQITGRRFGIGPKMFAGTQAGFARTQVSWLKMFAQANAGLTALSVRMRTAFAAGGMGAPGAGLRPGAPMPPGARMGGAQRSFSVAPIRRRHGRRPWSVRPAAIRRASDAGCARSWRGWSRRHDGRCRDHDVPELRDDQHGQRWSGQRARPSGRGKTPTTSWPWLGEQIDKMMGIYVAPAADARDG